MDTSKAVTHIGLCAGYGGIELGLHRAIPNLRSVALCEIEAFAIANLVSKMEAGLMDPAPIWTDLKTFPWGLFRDRVDIVTGGFPCQPFSAAGKRDGDEDPRHLFPFILSGIQTARPTLVFLENVDGIVSAKLAGSKWRDPAGTPVLLHVLRELERVGYRATAGVFSASEVGAPHQRKRVFILAYRDGQRGQLQDWRRLAAKPDLVGQIEAGRTRMAHRNGPGLPFGEGFGGIPAGQVGAHSREVAPCNHPCNAWPCRPGEQQYGWEPPRVVADRNSLDRSAQAEGWEHDRQAGSAGEELDDTGISGCDGRPDGTSWGIGEPREAGKHIAGCRGEGHGVRQTQPPLGGDADGSSGGMDYAELCISCDNRTDELRLLGNGVVPATAERAFRVLIKELL